MKISRLNDVALLSCEALANVNAGEIESILLFKKLLRSPIIPLLSVLQSIIQITHQVGGQQIFANKIFFEAFEIPLLNRRFHC